MEITSIFSLETTKPVVETIKSTKELKCLNLEANTLGVEAAKVIGDALSFHPEFEIAHWKDLFTGRLKTEIPEALKHLFSGIVRAKARLKALDLSDNALGPIGVEGMVDFLKSESCYSLQELRLNNNGLGIKGGTMLAEALIELSKKAEAAGTPLKLKVFIAGRNRLENPGAKNIFKIFFSCKKFGRDRHAPEWNFSCGTFTLKGANAMAKELPKMKNLEVINLGDCLLKTKGAIAIAEALSNLTLLKEVYMDSNEIQPDGGIAIVEAIANNPNISHLMLDGNCFGEEGAEEIVNMLKDFNKEDILGSLDDIEEPDDEEDDENEHREEVSDDEDEEDEVDVEEIEGPQIGISPLKRDSTKDLVKPVKCTPAEFLETPSAGRLLGLSGGILSSFLQEAKKRAENPNRDVDFGDAHSPEALIEEYIRLFVSVATFSTCNIKSVVDIVEELTRGLMKEALKVAQDNGLSSVVTNCILVHFGLVKSESKAFKITWDLRGCMVALTKQIPKPYFPHETKSTLQFFFSRFM
ncbi:Ran GTPase-activating protein 1 [Armadillidium vulgare]|nr:Ran GTPase-activating protein 1 [Armadillidium vulgare]